MYARWSRRLSEKTSAWTCCSTRDEIVPRESWSSSCGLRTIPFSDAMKPGGTVTTATTLPVRSCRSASSGESRTSFTFWLAWRIVRSTWKRFPPTTTVAGRLSSSTSATRGFELA
jgi:hypothetical protein